MGQPSQPDAFNDGSQLLRVGRSRQGRAGSFARSLPPAQLSASWIGCLADTPKVSSVASRRRHRAHRARECEREPASVRFREIARRRLSTCSHSVWAWLRPRAAWIGRGGRGCRRVQGLEWGLDLPASVRGKTARERGALEATRTKKKSLVENTPEKKNEQHATLGGLCLALARGCEVRGARREALSRPRPTDAPQDQRKTREACACLETMTTSPYDPHQGSFP